jgi:hypothetical protein
VTELTVSTSCKASGTTRSSFIHGAVPEKESRLLTSILALRKTCSRTIEVSQCARFLSYVFVISVGDFSTTNDYKNVIDQYVVVIVAEYAEHAIRGAGSEPVLLRVIAVSTPLDMDGSPQVEGKSGFEPVRIRSGGRSMASLAASLRNVAATATARDLRSLWHY